MSRNHHKLVSRCFNAVFFMSRFRYVLIICVIVIGTLAIDLMLTRHAAYSVDIGPLNQLQCQTGSGLSKQLNIQVYTAVAAHQITQTLCQSALIQHHYGSVKLSWQARDTLSAVNLLNKDFEVIMGREHSLQGLVPNFAELYSPIIKFNGFSVYWFSYQQIDFNQLQNKTIGLVQDTLSHTHYLLPLQDLKTHHRNIDELDIRYYPDNYSLYKAFDSREVDMISTIELFRNGREDGLNSTRITNGNSATLFVSHTMSPSVRCEVIDALNPIVDYLTKVLNVRSVETTAAECEG